MKIFILDIFQFVSKTGFFHREKTDYQISSKWKQYKYIFLLFALLIFSNCSLKNKEQNMMKKNCCDELKGSIIDIIKKSINEEFKIIGKRIKYKVGQYGAKRREQKRLSKKYKIKVSGKTHEAEHPIGIEPLIRYANLKKNKKRIIKFAPAYQEVKKFHSKHVGTRNKGFNYYKKNMDEDAGFVSKTYRQTLRNLIDNDEISTAIQINQLGYAFLEGFDGDSISTKIADDSFMKMIKSFDNLSFSFPKIEEDFVMLSSYIMNDIDDDTVLISELAPPQYNIKESIEAIVISPKQKIEMYLSRLTARTKIWPEKMIEDIVYLNKKIKSEDNNFCKIMNLILTIHHNYKTSIF